MIDYRKFIKKDYKLKYRLLCNKCEISIKKFGELENKSYISQILITDKTRTDKIKLNKYKIEHYLPSYIIKKYSNLLAQSKINTYISQILITEKNDKQEAS